MGVTFQPLKFKGRRFGSVRGSWLLGLGGYGLWSLGFSFRGGAYGLGAAVERGVEVGKVGG